MVEITSQEQNKVKRMERTEDSFRDPWDNIKCTNIQIIGVTEEEKKKVYKKIFEEIIVENFHNMEKEIVNQVQKAQSPIQDKSKEKHAKTHTNQTNKDSTQRKNIKSINGKATSNIQGKPHTFNN